MRTIGLAWMGGVWLRLAMLLTLAAGACVGGDDGSGPRQDASGCFPCGDGTCFNCGSGCVCSDAAVGFDAGVWTPPFEPALIGEDNAWHQSESTFCPGAFGFGEPDLWSDERGVYVVISRTSFDFTGSNELSAQPEMDEKQSAPLDVADKALPILDAGFAEDAPVPAGAGGAAGFGGFGGVGGTGIGSDTTKDALFLNDGDGWQALGVVPHGTGEQRAHRLSGVPGGPLALHGANGGDGCSLGLFEDGSVECARRLGDTQAFFAVSADSAYSAIGSFLVHYDGTGWTSLAAEAPNNITALWASEEVVIAGTDLGTILRFDLASEAWTEVSPSVGSPLISIWSRSDGIYAGTLFGELIRSRDGVSEVIYRDNEDAFCIAGQPLNVWGTGDALYFYTRGTLHRLIGDEDERIGQWDCNNGNAALTRVWGNAPDEVFLMFLDESRRFIDPCGGAYVLFFDGTQVHSL